MSMKTFDQAVRTCMVRGYIARRESPELHYWKNHPVPLDKRVPLSDQRADDWDDYDPEGEETSIVG